MVEPSTRSPIELIAPMGPCPVKETRPTFRWRALGTKLELSQGLKSAAGPNARKLTDNIRWRLRLWEMPPRERVSRVMRTPPLLNEIIDGDRSGLLFPRRAAPLTANRAYLWRVERIGSRNRVLSRSSIGLFFVENPALPIPLSQWLCCGENSVLAADISAWQPVYGTPLIDAKGKGCDASRGVIRLQGTALAGDAVGQHLDPADSIQEGKHYLVSFCARGADKLGDARFRVMAHNGPLPDSGNHPPTSSQCVPIAETGRIAAGEWTWVLLPPWRAPRAFTRITIAAITDSDHSEGDQSAPVAGELSNICVRRVDDCAAVGFRAGDGPQFNLGDGVSLDLSNPPVAQMVSSRIGAMQDLAGPIFDGSGQHNWYRPGDGCVSIGGWIPPDWEEKVPWHRPDQTPWPADEVIDKAIEQVLMDLKDPVVVDDLDPIPFQPEDCSDFNPAPFPRELRRPDDWAEPSPPFAGRDIAFVHGFVPSQVIARIVADDPLIQAVYFNLPVQDPLQIEDVIPNVQAEWPSSEEAFAPEGYFRTFAETTYWHNHIQEFLRAPGHPNRYMVAAYNCSQRLVYGVHALLSQIAAAMNSGAGVRVPQNSNRGTACFGKELVIISHSTGALVTNVAMAVAARTADDSDLQAIYGDISGLAERAVVHISMHGALAGSEAAQLAVAGAGIWGGMVAAADIDTDLRLIAMRMIAAVLFTDPDEQPSVDAFFAAIQSVDDAFVAAGLTIPRVVFNSVLVDLSPLVTTTLWRPFVGGSPVPTLTLSSGHPSYGGAGPYVLKPVLPGLDDGVVSTNSQAGSDNLFPPDLYAYVPPKERIFDMGLPLIRSMAFFLEQDRGHAAAYGAIPFLSPSGMVQPVAAVPGIPRWSNVHPFLQATSEHSYTTNPNDPGQGTGSLLEEYLPSFGARNYEESLVVESPEPFNSGLVDPAVAELVFRYERRLDLTLTLRFEVPRITIFPPSFSMETVTRRTSFPLWRRFYDLLGDGDGSQPVTSTADVDVTATPDSITVSSEPASPDVVEAALVGTSAPGEVTYAYRYVMPF